MSKAKIILVALLILILAGVVAYRRRWSIYPQVTSPHLNYTGGDITIVNAKIWTGTRTPCGKPP